MEFLLLPFFRGDPPIPVPRTPYIATERYDGGPWLSYPSRKGMLKGMLKDETFDIIEYTISERVNPVPLREKEAFFQSWLYFGLIAEFIGANSKDVSSADASAKDMLSRVYEMVLDKDEKFVTLTEECLQGFLALGRVNMAPDQETRKLRYEHLKSCLSTAHSCAAHFPPTFNQAVRCSIAALGELFTSTINFALEAVKLPLLGRDWKTVFLSEDDKISMRAHGWCPSDVARAEAKYTHLQTLYICRFLDKSLPKRDHSRCTPSACNLYQINNTTYTLQHQMDSCNCDQLLVPEEQLNKVLFKEEKFPLLLLKGDLQNLTYEIVESAGEETPYIAISHVWADGLGNPHANSLQKCKLQHLRALVDAINLSDPPKSKSRYDESLIWLDTLLSPAQGGRGKQLAIEKIRLVYQNARHVLVLDAGLMAYPSEPQSPPEILVRIFTSSWMRRLWTLQEGALAPSLYFQFQDKALALNSLAMSVSSRKDNMSYRALTRDVYLEMLGLLGFFNKGMEGPGGILGLLDRALQFRSVSVKSDEALCIGTLLSLDLSAILEVEKTQECRMRKVWELISARNENGGVPSQVVFLEEETLEGRGSRWAPLSLLNSQSGINNFTMSTRLVRWADRHLGAATEKGLRVTYPGFRLTMRKDYSDEKPPNPWPGMPRMPEDWIQFVDENGKLFRIVEKRFAALAKKWEMDGEGGKGDEERRAYGALGLFPLNDLVASGKCMLMCRRNENGDLCEGILGTTEEDDEIIKKKDKEGIRLRTRHHALIQLLRGESYIYKVISQLALQLRADPLTDAHLALHARLTSSPQVGDSASALSRLGEENEEFRASLKALKDKMKEVTLLATKEDERFEEEVRMHFGEGFSTKIWVLVQDFFHHDIVAEELGDETVWFVD